MAYRGHGEWLFSGSGRLANCVDIPIAAIPEAVTSLLTRSSTGLVATMAWTKAVNNCGFFDGVAIREVETAGQGDHLDQRVRT